MKKRFMAQRTTGRLRPSDRQQRMNKSFRLGVSSLGVQTYPNCLTTYNLPYND